MAQYRSEPMGSVIPLRPGDVVVRSADSDRPVLTPELARALSSIVRRLYSESTERKAA
jgi:hypothetical protein